MLWIKTVHIIFLISWFAGLFYLPRLFVYHAMCKDQPSNERFKLMEHKLFYRIMMPSSVLTILCGFWLWLGYGYSGGWLHAKLLLVILLVAYHVWCYCMVQSFHHDQNSHGHVFYRWMNEIPTLLLILIIILAVVKPF